MRVKSRCGIMSIRADRPCLGGATSLGQRWSASWRLHQAFDHLPFAQELSLGCSPSQERWPVIPLHGTDRPEVVRTTCRPHGRSHALGFRSNQAQRGANKESHTKESHKWHGTKENSMTPVRDSATTSPISKRLPAQAETTSRRSAPTRISSWPCTRITCGPCSLCLTRSFSGVTLTYCVVQEVSS